MAVYSHSKLSAFEQCPLKFKYRYIEKKTPDIEKTIEAPDNNSKMITNFISATENNNKKQLEDNIRSAFKEIGYNDLSNE